MKLRSASLCPLLLATVLGCSANPGAEGEAIGSAKDPLVMPIGVSGGSGAGVAGPTSSATSSTSSGAPLDAGVGGAPPDAGERLDASTSNGTSSVASSTSSGAGFGGAPGASSSAGTGSVASSTSSGVGAGGAGGDASSPVPAGLPVLIALGDSLTSGHHGGGQAVVCDDASFGYPARVLANLTAASGEDWFVDGQYVNLAHSGFGTHEVLQGGTNACGATFDAPITDAVNLLKQHPNPAVSNRVVISVGINNTNWVTVLTGVAQTVALGVKLTAAQCATRIAAWNGPGVSFIDGDTGIFQGVLSILNQLVAADPNVKISFVGYYNMANTGFSVTDNSGPYAPAVCQAAVAQSQQQINVDWIQAAITQSDAAANTTFVDTSFLNGKNAELQQLTGTGVKVTTTGWPHPNDAGHKDIGDHVVPPPGG